MFSFFRGRSCMSLSEVHDPHDLGDKAESLWTMQRLGINIPSSFIVKASAQFNVNYVHLSDEYRNEIKSQLFDLERATGKLFFSPGDSALSSEAPGTRFPLLLSIRESVKQDEPFCSTVLNVGMNQQVVDTMVRLTSRPFYSLDCYRRFIQSYGVNVLGQDKKLYRDIIARSLDKRNLSSPHQWRLEDLTQVVSQMKSMTLIPDDPFEQVVQVVEAIHRHHDSLANSAYRNARNMRDLGTTIIVQEMVYGNLTNLSSGAGVVTSRDADSGEHVLSGYYISRVEGGDEIIGGKESGAQYLSIEKDLKIMLPEVYDELNYCLSKIEHFYCDAVKVDFTIENGLLYLLSSEIAPRSPIATFQISSDLVKEGLISKEETIMRIHLSHVCDSSASASDTSENKYEGGSATSTDLWQCDAAKQMLSWCDHIRTHCQMKVCSAHDAPFAQLSAKDIAKQYQQEREKQMYTTPPIPIASTDSGTGTGATSTADAQTQMPSPSAVSGYGTGMAREGLDVTQHAPATHASAHDSRDIPTVSTVSDDRRNASTTVPTLPSRRVNRRSYAMDSANAMGVTDASSDEIHIYSNVTSMNEMRKSNKNGCDGITLGLESVITAICEDNLLIITQGMIGAGGESLKAALDEVYPQVVESLEEALHLMPHLQLPNTHDCAAEVSPPVVNAVLFDASFARSLVLLPFWLEFQVRALVESVLVVQDETQRPFEMNIVLPTIVCSQELDYLLPHVLNTIDLSKCGHAASTMTASDASSGNVSGGIATGTDSVETMSTATPLPLTTADLTVHVGVLLNAPRALLRVSTLLAYKELEFIAVDLDALTECVFGFTEKESFAFIQPYIHKNILIDSPFEVLDFNGVGKLLNQMMKDLKTPVAARFASASSGSTSSGGLHFPTFGTSTSVIPLKVMMLSNLILADPPSLQFLHRIGINAVSCDVKDVQRVKISATQALLNEKGYSTVPAPEASSGSTSNKSQDRSLLNPFSWDWSAILQPPMFDDDSFSEDDMKYLIA